MPIGKARPWCSRDPECVLEDGHGGSECEVAPGARDQSRKREQEAATRGVHPTRRDKAGRAVSDADAEVVAAAMVTRDATVTLRDEP